MAEENRKRAFDFYEKCVEILMEKNWGRILTDFESMGRYSSLNAVRYALGDAVPPDYLYHLMVKIYTSNSYDFEASDILKMQKLRPANYVYNLPEKYREKGTLTVWRASMTPPEQISLLSKEFSWTLNQDTALFYAVMRQAHDKEYRWRYIYRASIDVDKIIAFSDIKKYGFHEEEVIQYDGVTDVEYVPVPMEDWISTAEKEVQRWGKLANKANLLQATRGLVMVQERAKARTAARRKSKKSKSTL